MNIKKIIAREGLVILGIIGIAIFIIITPPLYIKPKSTIEVAKQRPSLEQILGDKKSDKWEKYVVWDNDKETKTPEEIANEKRSNIELFGFQFLILAYPAYLLIRFIIWAVRTLKDKSN